jgi:hypothetical protein
VKVEISPFDKSLNQTKDRDSLGRDSDKEKQKEGLIHFFCPSFLVTYSAIEERFLQCLAKPIYSGFY